VKLYSRVHQIGRVVGQVHRLRVIVGVFLKYGYDDIAGKLPLPGMGGWLPTSRFRPEQAERAELPRAARLRLAFEELGPACVKLGQLLTDRKLDFARVRAGRGFSVRLGSILVVLSGFKA
jgi:predicted unusual protein kinase regulating ubiquinone biosynthesis (AarF/ABC1/UbiB family)